MVERAAPRAVLKPANRHAPAPDTAPLPAPVLAVLAAIATDLRHLPRDCIVDRAELLVWLRRMAGRVDGVAQLRLVLKPPRPRRAPASPAAGGAAPSAREAAEAVFGQGRAAQGRPGAPRTILCRRGRAVRVEFRRARDAGQMEMW